VGKYLGWSLVKELVLHVGCGLIERGCDSICLGIRRHLLGWPPIWTTLIERVQNDIASLSVVEPLEVFASGIVDDGGVPTISNLAEDLHDELGLPHAGITHYLEVLGFFAQRNPHHLAQFRRLEPNAVTLLLPVEFLRGQHLRTA
jgi:hypothetical protein